MFCKMGLKLPKEPKNIFFQKFRVNLFSRMPKIVISRVDLFSRNVQIREH